MSRLDLEKFLEALAGGNQEQTNWLVDREAEYLMGGFSPMDAKEKAMQDWHSHVADRNKL